MDLIEDTRVVNDFKTSTFSGYKKTEVKLALLDALRNGKVENACYWSAELVCAGHFVDLWDTLLFVLGKYIHHGNPLMVQYYRRRMELFRQIVNAPGTDLLDLRNNATIRQLFAEVAATVALTEKKPSYEEIQVEPVIITTQLKADRPDYASDVMRPLDPKECVISLNEFCYHVYKTRNMTNACYWMEWLLQFAALCKKNGAPLFCERRDQYTDVDRRYQKDVIWLVWESILSYGSQGQNQIQGQTHATLNTLFELFRIRYTGHKKRKYLLYFAISLLTEQVQYNTELVSDMNKDIIRIATDNIGEIYKMLKPHQQKGSPSLSYSMNEKKQNLNDSMQKWKLMYEHDAAFL